MTTPMSLQPWWWKIVILIQLWSQFFQMFVFGDVVYAQLGIDPGKLYRATFICQDGLCCCNVALISFRLFRKNLGNLKDFFGQMVYRPPGKKFPYAYDKTDGYVYLFGEQDSKKVLSIPPGQVDFLAGIFFQTHLPNAQDSGRSPYKWIINYRKAGNGPRKAKCESCLNVATHVRTWSWKRFERKV